jgi:hypothetical protein
MYQLFDHLALCPFAHIVYNDSVSDWYHITTLNREIGFILDTDFFFHQLEIGTGAKICIPEPRMGPVNNRGVEGF